MSHIRSGKREMRNTNLVPRVVSEPLSQSSSWRNTSMLLLVKVQEKVGQLESFHVSHMEAALYREPNTRLEIQNTWPSISPSLCRYLWES